MTEAWERSVIIRMTERAYDFGLPSRSTLSFSAIRAWAAQSPPTG